MDTDEHGFAQDAVAGYEMSSTKKLCPSISYPPLPANAAALSASLRSALERIRGEGQLPLLSSALNQSEAEVTSRRLGTVATGAKRINKLAYRVLW